MRFLRAYAVFTTVSWVVLFLLEAQGALRYRVEIVAIPELKALLTRNLEITKWCDHPNLDEHFLRSLYSKTPLEIERLLGTEGYFSPEITPELVETHPTWVARFLVNAGEPSTVSSVSIEFSGEILSQPPSASFLLIL